MKTEFVCSNCGSKSLKWLGKCPNCNSWNSFEEVAVISKKPNQKTPDQFEYKTKPVSLDNLYKDISQNDQNQNFIKFSSSELNEFWGLGLTKGSLTLLAGEPGIGKSTFALQIIRDLLKANSNLKTLYVSAEESVTQLATRAKRLQIPANIEVLANNNLEQILVQISKLITPENNNLVIIDSVQTIYSQISSGSPGSVSQVTYIVNTLLALAKSQNITIILIGHVTKTGDIAGPKTLEHMVDSVLLVDQPQAGTKYRSLGFTKHRFGSTDKMLFLEMAELGLTIVKNPSLILIENLERGTGICYSLALDRQIPLLIEIQALVHQSTGNFGRREANGIPNTKLNIIVAILEKYLHLELKFADIYLQVLGLPKGLTDDSLDLAILLALISSLQNSELSTLLNSKTSTLEATGSKDKRSIYTGRLTLSGAIRQATSKTERESAAKKLGFLYNQGLTNVQSVSELKTLLV